MNLPNKITIARICLIPIMVIIPFFHLDEVLFLNITTENLVLLIIFLIGSLTDYLDGHLARKNNMVTTFGKFLDPIADKLLVATALIILVENGVVPSWIPIITLTREFIVSGIRMLAAGKGTVIAASYLGKIKTVSQMVAISLAFLSPERFFAMGNPINILMSIAMLFSVVVTIWSGIDYFVKSKEVLLESK